MVRMSSSLGIFGHKPELKDAMSVTAESLLRNVAERSAARIFTMAIASHLSILRWLLMANRIENAINLHLLCMKFASGRVASVLYIFQDASHVHP